MVAEQNNSPSKGLAAAINLSKSRCDIHFEKICRYPLSDQAFIYITGDSECAKNDALHTILLEHRNVLEHDIHFFFAVHEVPCARSDHCLAVMVITRLRISNDTYHYGNIRDSLLYRLE